MKRLGASGGRRERQLSIRSARTKVSSSKAMPPRLSATICTALLRPCRARLEKARLKKEVPPNLAKARTMNHASKPNTISPATKPPSTVSPSFSEPACHKNKPHNTAPPEAYNNPVPASGAPSSRRITRNGETLFNCHNGRNAKPSNNAMPLAAACHTGVQPGGGNAASRIAAIDCTSTACAI